MTDTAVVVEVDCSHPGAADGHPAAVVERPVTQSEARQLTIDRETRAAASPPEPSPDLDRATELAAAIAAGAAMDADRDALLAILTHAVTGRSVPPATP